MTGDNLENYWTDLYEIDIRQWIQQDPPSVMGKVRLIYI